MASSSSIKRAQAIKLCELCQEDSIKWRCVDCDRCLCEKCKTIHLRVPVTAQHQIVTIGTPLQDVPKKIFTDNIPCKDHPKKMTCLFCRSCNSLICPDCVSSSHKRHNFESIESALDEKLDNLRGIHDKVNANLKHCDSKTSEIKNMEPKFNAIFDESVTNIKQREHELIDVIRKYSKALQERVEKERSQVNSNLSKVQKKVDNTKKNLEDKGEELNAILSSSQGGVILKATIEMKDVKFDSLPNQIEHFIPGKESTKTIHESFGSFQTLTISPIHFAPEIDFEVLKTFTTDLPYINQVATLDVTSAWINCLGKDMIRKVNIQIDTMTTSQEIKLPVFDMAVTLNNELLLTLRRANDVKLMKRSGEVVTLLTVAPLLPRRIHVTKDNDVIVGVKDNDDPYTTTDRSQRALIVFDMSGQQKQRYQYDKEGKRLFTYPYRITTNNNQDILVVDSTSGRSGTTGRVVALNKEGSLKWLYEGHPQINANKQFDPNGIVTTAAGYVIVSDCESDALHVLSEEGDILTCKVMRDMGIMHPWGLDIDNEGRLWVGCDKGDEETGAKLHVMKLIAKASLKHSGIFSTSSI